MALGHMGVLNDFVQSSSCSSVLGRQRAFLTALKSACWSNVACTLSSRLSCAFLVAVLFLAWVTCVPDLAI